jgi:methanogenic corrinoid protein MtbC1
MADETVEDFVLLALSGDHDALMAVVGAMVERGVTMEAVYLDLLAPVARRLGERWLDDTISFVDVTIALGKLQLVVHALSLHGPVGADEPSGGRSAYFTNAPGEQHTFGVSIVAEFFRRAGWMAAVSCDSDPAVVLEAVRRRHFDVVGITIACVEHLAQLKPFVMSIRRVSINPDTVVLVGGRLLSERPGLAKEVGADCSAGDAREAFLTAEGAVRLLARR